MSEDERIWYELGIIIGKKEYKDKIKSIIEELEKELKEYEKMEDCNMKYDSVFQIETEINILLSLSEKRSKTNE